MSKVSGDRGGRQKKWLRQSETWRVLDELQLTSTSPSVWWPFSSLVWTFFSVRSETPAIFVEKSRLIVNSALAAGGEKPN